jgi:hypothetical protein
LINAHPRWAGVLTGTVAVLIGLLTGALAPHGIVLLGGLAAIVAGLVGAAKQASP